MRRALSIALILVTALPLWSQTGSKWTVGTVMAVKPHTATATAASGDSAPQYDVTVRVARIDYVVLYTEPVGAPGVEYTEGRDAPVLVGSKTLSFRDKLGQKVDLPILSKKPAGTEEKKK